MRRNSRDENSTESPNTRNMKGKRRTNGESSRSRKVARMESVTEEVRNEEITFEETHALCNGTLPLDRIWNLAKKLRGPRQEDSTNSMTNPIEWSPAQTHFRTLFPDNQIKKMDHRKTYETMVTRKNGRDYRRPVVRSGLKLVKYDDKYDLLFAEKTFRELVEADPRLVGLKRSFRMFMGIDHLEGRRKAILEVWKGVNNEVESERLQLTQSAMMKALGPYTPPAERVLVMKNLTKNWFDPIPVYSDLVGETEMNVQIPDSLLYVYGYRNLIGEETARELQRINTLSQKISCKCCSREPLIPCWTNPDCDCAKVAKALTWSDKKYVNPLDSNDVGLLQVDGTIDFSCSEDCACKGNCTNNALLTIERKLLQFEVFKRNDLIGYSLRTLNAIPAGTPVLEFTGELVRSDLMDQGDLDYAMELDIAKDIKVFSKDFRNCPEANWSKAFQMEYKKITAKNWMINPKWYGNASRTCAHSCDPNLMTMKVFQKGFTPSCVRLILVANRDIFPGTELTLDYGESYKWGDGVKCQCGSLACVNSPFEPLGYNQKESVDQIEQYIACRQAKGFLDYKTMLATTQN